MLLCGTRDFPFAFAYLCLSVLLRICNKKHREKFNKVVRGKNIYMLTFPLLLLLTLKSFSVKISCGNKTSFLTVYIKNLHDSKLLYRHFIIFKDEEQHQTATLQPHDIL